MILHDSIANKFRGVLRHVIESLLVRRIRPWRTRTVPHSSVLTRGQVLLPMLFILVLLVGLLGLALGSAAFLQTLQSGQRVFSEQAKAAADAGIRDALLRLSRDRNFKTDVASGCTLASATCGATSGGLPLLTFGEATAHTWILQDTSGPQSCVAIVATGTMRSTCRKFEARVRVPENGNVIVDSWKEITQ